MNRTPAHETPMRSAGRVVQRPGLKPPARMVFSRRRMDDGGYSTVEAVILLPLLVLFTLFVIQVAQVWNARNVAEAAARQGALAARGYGATDSDGRRAAQDYLDAINTALLHHAHIDVRRTGEDVSVRVQAQVLAVPAAPFMFTVDERSSGPVEHFVAEPDARP